MSKRDDHPRLGSIIQAARQKQGWSLRQLGERLRKEDGSSFSPQYLNDIEHERRTPPPEFLDQLADILGLESQILRSLAGHQPPEVKEYLAEMPEQGETIGRLFRRARERRFTDWEQVEQLLLQFDGKRPQ